MGTKVGGRLRGGDRESARKILHGLIGFDTGIREATTIHLTSQA